MKEYLYLVDLTLQVMLQFEGVAPSPSRVLGGPRRPSVRPRAVQAPGTGPSQTPGSSLSSGATTLGWFEGTIGRMEQAFQVLRIVVAETQGQPSLARAMRCRLNSSASSTLGWRPSYRPSATVAMPGPALFDVVVVLPANVWRNSS